MDKMLMKKQIQFMTKQRELNDRDLNQIEKTRKENIRNINDKIKKTILKAEKQKLLNEKKKIEIDYDNCIYIHYLCEKNIRNCLNSLYNQYNES